MKGCLQSIALVTMIVIAVSPVFATTLNVPADYATIQAGLDAAANGDTVLVQPDVYFENLEWPLVNGIKLIAAGDADDTIIDGDFDGNVIVIESGGVIDTATLIHGFTVRNGNEYVGIGIKIEDSSPTIANCRIVGNLGGEFSTGGGISCEYAADPLIVNCVISGNSAEGGGGLWCYHGASPTLINCTITDNFSFDGAGIRHGSGNLTLVNCIVSDNNGQGLRVTNSGTTDISYCDFYNNSDGDFGGSDIDPDLGVVVGTNANGDLCDAYYNIFLDPMYVDPGNGDYHLQADSPCIDAGDPSRPYDPDNTVADIGAFYFDQGTAEPVVVTLTPTSSTDVPATGGSITYDANVVSNLPGTYPNVVFWTKVKLPNGNFYAQIQFQTTFTLYPYMEVTGSLTQDIPAFAPAGEYEMWGWVGFNPNSGPSFGDFFPFTKAP